MSRHVQKQMKNVCAVWRMASAGSSTRVRARRRSRRPAGRRHRAFRGTGDRRPALCPAPALVAAADARRSAGRASRWRLNLNWRRGGRAFTSLTSRLLSPGCRALLSYELSRLRRAARVLLSSSCRVSCRVVEARAQLVWFSSDIASRTLVFFVAGRHAFRRTRERRGVRGLERRPRF